MEFSIVDPLSPSQSSIHVITAENGADCDVELTLVLGGNVNRLQTILEERTSLKKSDQILLLENGRQLDSGEQLNNILKPVIQT